jgi:four helix bundle protein
MTTKGEVILYRKYVEMQKLLIIYLNHFPRYEKYALAQTIRETSYEVFNLIIEGQKRYYKKTTLQNLDIAHEKLRMQIFLAFELGYFNFKDGRKVQQLPKDRYLSISKMIDELGRLIGAWIKKLKTEDKFK